MDDDGAPWNEWSASDVASKLVDDDGGLRSARLARERGASRERLRKERAKLKDHIKRNMTCVRGRITITNANRKTAHT